MSILAKLTPEVRTALYGVGVAAMPILVLLHVVSDSDVPLFLGLGDAFLTLGVALGYRPTGPAGPTELDTPGKHANDG